MYTNAVQKTFRGSSEIDDKMCLLSGCSAQGAAEVRGSRCAEQGAQGVEPRDVK